MYTKLKTYKENILVPRNLDGRQDKLKQQAIRLLSQEVIDGDFTLEDYMLDIPSNLVKVKKINGDLNCYSLGLIEFPKWFERLTINGSFYCYYNRLTTLKFCPKFINSDFYCNDNKLISLEGCPQTVNGVFNINNNILTSLKYCSHNINSHFYCQYNKLASLEGCPKNINGDFLCYNNKLIDLEYGPKIVNGDYYCWNNLVKLQQPENCKIKGKFINNVY